MFDDKVAGMINVKNLELIVTELLIYGQNPGVFLFFIIQSYYGVPKNVRLNSTHYFITNIQNKYELQQIA